MALQWTWENVPEGIRDGWVGLLRLCNRRFRDLQNKMAGLVAGPAGGGTTNAIPKWVDASTLGPSSLTDTGTQVRSSVNVRLANGSGNGISHRKNDDTGDLQSLYRDAVDDLWFGGGWVMRQSGAAWAPSVDAFQDIGETSKQVRAIYLAPATTSLASLKVPHGTAPSSPVDGDIWTTTAGAYVRINGVTVGPLGTGGGGGGGSGGTATLSFGASGSTSASVTVTGQAWVTGSNAIVCTVADDARAEDAAIEGLTLAVANQVAGDGFDIIGAPAIGDFVGDVIVAFVGV